MKFKTNARCGGCKAAIMEAVKRRFPDLQWDMEVESADKVLECHGVPDDAAKAAEIIKTIEETGFKGSLLPAGSN